MTSGSLARDPRRGDDSWFDVGGVRLARPFKIRRLGHFGYNCDRIEEMVEFYIDHLGLTISDRSERLAARQAVEVQATLRPAERALHFARYGTEHHQLVLIAAKLWNAVDPTAAGRSINQVTWQVGSLAEVVDASTWLADHGAKVLRAGRDMPGSNWHTYLADPDGHVHELYYGMEQIGWNGLSKPREMWERDGHLAAPSLPRPAEAAEVAAAERDGVALDTGTRPPAPDRAPFDVDGVLLARPFKVVGLGPVSLYVADLDAAVDFHRDVLGFTETARVSWGGFRGVLLRHGPRHHDLALYDAGLRRVFGHGDDRSAVALGVRVANYRQLRAAVDHLVAGGAAAVTVPAELVPGFDYVAHVRDPEGNLVQLYYHLGTAATPPPTTVSGGHEEWPELIDAPDDVFGGEVFLGPWM